MAAKPKKNKKRYNYFGLVKAFWTLVVLAILGVALTVGLAALGAFGPLPTFEEIENPKSNLASEIITADGKQLGKFYLDNRTHAAFKDLSPHLVNALVATEDERYYKHSGIDFQSLARAAFLLGAAGGGSTITQQLAKQLFHEPASSIWDRIPQKFKEWVIAVQLERQYTKQEIIAMYFNQLDFLYQAVGINSAAKIYFNKTPDSLQIEEAAVLVGMAKNPALYNPKRFPERMKTRRNVVLGQMHKNGMLSREKLDSLSQLPIKLRFKRQNHLAGQAPYFRAYLRSYLSKWIERNPRPDGSHYNLYTDGLKIYTTIDSRMQQYAEEAVTEHMSNLQRVFFEQEKDRPYAPFHSVTEAEIDRLMQRAMRRTPRYRRLVKAGASRDSIRENFQKPIPMRVFSWEGDIDTVMSPMDSIRYYKHFYQTGLLSVEPQTGFIKAWVGGIDFEHFKYDHVKQGRRQVGSTFKPFVYSTAIEQLHYSPCFEVPNVRTCIEEGQYGLLEDWCPSNAGDEYGGVYTLEAALANSVNTVTTYLMKQVGPRPVINLLRDMGVKAPIDTQPAIALGAVDLSVHEMVGSYTTFANKGVYTQPLAVTRIEDKNGVVLEEFTPFTREVMSAKDAYVVLKLLQGVTAYGTGARLRSRGGRYLNDVVTGFPYAFTNPIAGKTGTTQNNSDGWFMGTVPNLVTGVWSGCEDRAAHFGATYYGQGATVSLPTWALFMEKCYADPSLSVSKGAFEKPEGALGVELDCEEYERSASGDTSKHGGARNDPFDY